MVAHMSLDERREVSRFLHHKVPIREAVLKVGRHPATIYRELRRNFWHNREVPAAEGYWLITSQNLANARRARQRKLSRQPELCAAVVERLKNGWLPEQIAGRLKQEGQPCRVCHETIYRSSIRRKAARRSWQSIS